MYPPTHREDSPPKRGAPAPAREVSTRTRCRSFCFIERAGTRWTVFLITFLRPDGQWRGYFTFRSSKNGLEQDEIRTADLFVEDTEQEVDQRARSLGRPLILALLESALDTWERRRDVPPHLQRWFRDLLSRHAAENAPAVYRDHSARTPTLAELRSLYDSYRLDQVMHLIALMDPEDFREAVEVRLEGRRIDFQARDRFQLAMSVVQDLEQRLPLPPFELWAEDFLDHAAEYRTYSAQLHAGNDLP
jgi:hypothetical protein